MLALLATLAFGSILWLAVALLARIAGESGDRILDALLARPLADVAPLRFERARRGDARPSPMPVTTRWRAAA